MALMKTVAACPAAVRFHTHVQDALDPEQTGSNEQLGKAARPSSRTRTRGPAGDRRHVVG